MEYDFTRYLAAKKRIDDRCLNHAVCQSLARQPVLKQNHRPLRIIELGAGIGTMVERLLEQQLWRDCHYTAIEKDAANLEQAGRRLENWAAARNLPCRSIHPGTFLMATQQGNTTVELRQADVYRFMQQHRDQYPWDLLVAHAFMDLVNLREVLSLCRDVVRPGGLLYLTLNFDGETILLPPSNSGFDTEVIDAYHRTMDDRRIDGRPSGDSRTGRHLFDALNHIGASVIAAGSSDWVVHPVNGTYHPDESYFLHYIIHTITKALEKAPQLDGKRLAEWQYLRNRQIERGELVYIAKQLDFLSQLVPAGEICDR
jgi:SAM-dependent methyltransferase